MTVIQLPARPSSAPAPAAADPAPWSPLSAVDAAALPELPAILPTQTEAVPARAAVGAAAPHDLGAFPALGRVRDALRSPDAAGFLRALRREDGAATAEYAIATMAAVAFAGLLVVIMQSDEVRGMLEELVRDALTYEG